MHPCMSFNKDTSTNRLLLSLASNLKGEECYNVVWTPCKWNQYILFNHLFACACSVQFSLFRSSWLIIHLLLHCCALVFSYSGTTVTSFRPILFIVHSCLHLSVLTVLVYDQSSLCVVATLSQVTTLIPYTIVISNVGPFQSQEPLSQPFLSNFWHIFHPFHAPSTFNNHLQLF